MHRRRGRALSRDPLSRGTGLAEGAYPQLQRFGRTARLGAEGDAISFACERYAQSLPEIEAYIEQKIPVEPVTSELLTALPRAPREGVELDAEDGESISEIFK